MVTNTISILGNRISVSTNYYEKTMRIVINGEESIVIDIDDFASVSEVLDRYHSARPVDIEKFKMDIDMALRWREKLGDLV